MIDSCCIFLNSLYILAIYSISLINCWPFNSLIKCDLILKHFDFDLIIDYLSLIWINFHKLLIILNKLYLIFIIFMIIFNPFIEHFITFIFLII